MAADRQSFLDMVLEGYSQSYDVERTVPDGSPVSLAAKAVFHVTQTGYVLLKKAQTWSADSDEFTYFFAGERLDDAACEAAIKYAWEDGRSRIDLRSKDHHMCSRITTVFIYDEIEEAAGNRIRKSNLYKSFMLSLKGWMELHTAAVGLDKGETFSNRYGKPTAVFLEEVLHPQPRNAGRKGFGIFSKNAR